MNSAASAIRLSFPLDRTCVGLPRPYSALEAHGKSPYPAAQRLRGLWLGPSEAGVVDLPVPHDPNPAKAEHITYGSWASASTGGGVSAAAQITRAKASSLTVRPRVSSGSGSEKTIGPAAIVRAFAATLVTAITETAGPIWRLRAETSSPASDATRITAASGLNRIAAAELSPSSPLSALIEVSEAAQSRPAEAPKRMPARGRPRPA